MTQITNDILHVEAETVPRVRTSGQMMGRGGTASGAARKRRDHSSRTAIPETVIHCDFGSACFCGDVEEAEGETSLRRMDGKTPVNEIP
ncbi:MAG: hypothetical protein ACLU9S_15695 [Oscillospiraceae bacterium]